MEEFLSPKVYNLVLDNKLNYTDYPIQARRIKLLSNYLLTTTRLNKYNYDLTLFFNISELKKEVTLIDLLIYCYFLNINLSHIKNLEDKDELYEIILMVIIVYYRFKNITLKDIIDNNHLEKLLYLSLDERYWIKKSIEILYGEILDNSLTINEDIEYQEIYKSVRHTYNEIRCSNHKFIIKREIYIMLDKNLDINIIESEFKENPNNETLKKYFIDDSEDINYRSLESLIKEEGYLFKTKLDYMKNISNNTFYYVNNILYYGLDKIEDNYNILLEKRDQVYLLCDNEDIIIKFQEMIEEEFNRKYNKLMNVMKEELKDYLSITDIYKLIFDYKYLEDDIKDLLSYMIVDECKFLDNYILEGHKNILVYTRRWLKRL